NHFSAIEGDVVFSLIHGRYTSASHRRNAEELERDRHRVSCELTPTGSGAWAGMVFEVFEFGSSHRAGCMFSDRFKHVLNGHVMALKLARHDRTAVEHHRRQVEASEGHYRAWDGLVAA